jgi:hypothetical protein
MSSPKPVTYAVAGIAAVAVAFGGYALANSNSGSSTSAQAAQVAPAGQVPGAGGQQRGQRPPGFGTPVTGATADKVKAAALAKYKGTAERVMKLADGSYVVHVLTSNSEYHVSVSKDFKVTGAQQGGPGGRPGGPPPGMTPPSGAGAAPGTAS